MTLEELKADLMASMKKGDSNRVETLRFLLAAVRNAAIAKYGAAGEASVTPADIGDITKKQVKTHRESIDAFAKANRTDLVDKEQAQLTVLESFLPKQLSDEEIQALLAPVASSGEKNFGLLMGQAMKAVAGRADGGRVSAILKKLLA